MATRVYFPTTTAAAVSPNQDAAWQYTSELLRRRLAHESTGTSAITIGTQIGPWTVGQRALDRQYVSDPLSAQTISGTVKGQLMVREYATGDDVTQIILGIRVVSRDGSTVRATLLSVGSYVTGAEFISNASHRNKKIADGDAISSYTCVTGDRLVVEIGYLDAGTGATPEASAKWGENATDLPENETQTTDGAGWLELSATLTFETIVDAAFIASGASVSAPSIALAFTDPFISSSAAVYAATPALVAAPSFVASGATVQASTFALVLAAPTIASGSAVYAPTIEAEQIVEAAFIESTATVPGASLALETGVGAVSGTATAYQATAALDASPGLVEGMASVAAPAVALVADAPTVESAADVLAPAFALCLSAGFVASAAAVYAPTIEGPEPAPPTPVVVPVIPSVCLVRRGGIVRGFRQ